MIVSVAGVNADPENNKYIRQLMARVNQNQNTELLVTLLPEPTNPYDPEAVQVRVNDQMVGYIPKTDLKDIPKPIEKRSVYLFSWGIGKEEAVYLNLNII